MIKMRSPIPVVLLLPLLFVSTLGSCCALCAPGCFPEPTADEAIAEVSLILDVHPDSRAIFMALGERAQNLAVDRAWTQARTLLPASVYRDLGVHRLAVGADGWPTPAARIALANTVLGHAGLDLDDPPKGCQHDENGPFDEKIGSIRCEWPLRDLSTPAFAGQPGLRYELGFAIHCRFKSRNR